MLLKDIMPDLKDDDEIYYARRDVKYHIHLKNRILRFHDPSTGLSYCVPLFLKGEKLSPQGMAECQTIYLGEVNWRKPKYIDCPICDEVHICFRFLNDRKKRYICGRTLLPFYGR